VSARLLCSGDTYDRFWRPKMASLDIVGIISMNPPSQGGAFSLLTFNLTPTTTFFLFISLLLDFHIWPSKFSNNPNLFFFHIWSLFFLLLFVLFEIIHKIEIVFSISSSFSFSSVKFFFILFIVIFLIWDIFLIDFSYDFILL